MGVVHGGVVGSDVIVIRLRMLLFTSGFASESTSKLDSLFTNPDSGSSTESNVNADSDSANRIRP